MYDRYMMLKIETVINKILYLENVIDEKIYEQVSRMIDKLLFEESKKISSSILT